MEREPFLDFEYELSLSLLEPLPRRKRKRRRRTVYTYGPFMRSAGKNPIPTAQRRQRMARRTTRLHRK